jgi:dTDP-4-amino-4,6-dideoxygalactose transaminase
VDIGGELVSGLEELLVTRTLRRRALFRMVGPASHAWRAEQEIERLYPGRRCLLLPSATIGFTLLLELLDLEPGREILIAPFGWIANWSCIRRAGHIPRFLPLDDRLQTRVEHVSSRITGRTGAVVVTHMMGRGQQDIAAIAGVCADRGIPLLEDIAQSFGVSIDGRRAGTFGAGAWCSLNHHKILSTGDGGFALVRDGRLFERLCARHDQGHALAAGKRRPVGALEPGLSLRVNELTAAVLRAQLARYHLVRSRILALHRSASDACRGAFGVEPIPPHQGDVPFTVLFRRPEGMRYPTLVESGWHVAPNVAWLADAWAEAVREDAALARTVEALAAVAAVGAGFADPYYAVPIGLGITDTPADAPRLVETLAGTIVERAS